MSLGGFPAVYLDECVDRHLAPALAQQGFTVAHALLEGQRGLSDDEQLNYAVAHRWAILSHNKKHFQQCHSDWVQRARPHFGILIVPHKGRAGLIELRIAMLLTWIQQEDVPLPGHLWQWHDLHERLLGGLTLFRFSAQQIQYALTRTP
jgi:hypothetical protein